jgi:hypothetical protein
MYANQINLHVIQSIHQKLELCVILTCIPCYESMNKSLFEGMKPNKSNLYTWVSIIESCEKLQLHMINLNFTMYTSIDQG